MFIEKLKKERVKIFFPLAYLQGAFCVEWFFSIRNNKLKFVGMPSAAKIPESNGWDGYANAKKEGDNIASISIPVAEDIAFVIDDLKKIEFKPTFVGDVDFFYGLIDCVEASAKSDDDDLFALDQEMLSIGSDMLDASAKLKNIKKRKDGVMGAIECLLTL